MSVPFAPSTKTRYPRAAAVAVAREICAALEEWCDKIKVCGSLRRRKADVGDVEIVYISKVWQVQTDPQAALLESFETPRQPVCLVDAALETLRVTGKIARRQNVNGSVMWGPKNKFAVHVASGIPVDFFAATPQNWWNYIVCRTGGAESNVRIATAAQQRGWTWKPYGPGFATLDGLVPVTSEEEVFTLLGLPYLQPWER